MKKYKIITFFTIILLSFQSITLSTESNNNGNGDDLRYDRELLISARDNFITSNGDLSIKEITITGLEKTKKTVILHELEVSAGDTLSLFDPHRFINRLKRKNLFTDIHINYKNETDGVIIELSLQEKWTIIPLPMFYSNGESTAYGIYIIESNFMGYGKAVFTGFTYSEKSKTAMLGYIDPSVLWTNYAASLFVVYVDSIIQNGTIEKNILQEYSSKQTIVRLDAGYSFSGNIKLFLSEGYQSGIVDKQYSGSLNPPESQKFFLTGALLKFDFLKYYEYLYYGFKCEIKGYNHIPRGDGEMYQTVDFRADYSHKIFNYHRITLFSAGSAGNRPDIFEERISGKTGTRTLPADIISADNFINYSVVYEYPFLRLSRGAVTLLAFWEQGVYNEDHSPYNNYYGPGGGILFYMKRIAFPAVGFNYARNLKTKSSEFSISVGLNF
jgi:hypothetical protein